MSDIGDWFRSIPGITRCWFAAAVAVPLVGKLGLISPAYFFLWPEAFLYRFQVLTGDWGSGGYRSQAGPRRRCVERQVEDARCLVGFVVRRLQRFRAGSCGRGLSDSKRVWSKVLGSWRCGDKDLPRLKGTEFVLLLIRIVLLAPCTRRRHWERKSVTVVGLLDTCD